VKSLIPRLNIHYTLHDAFIALKSIFVIYPKTDNSCFYLNHARTGLRMALTSLNLPGGSKVGVMVYNCYSVMNAVKLAGLEIEFIDVTDDFCIDIYDFENKKDKLSALIVTHLFGIPNDIEQLKSLCPHIPIIEDCSHSFLTENGGELTGCAGDMAVFSMGLGKFPSIGPGGYLKVNNDRYLDVINESYTKLPAPSFLNEINNIGLSLLLSVLHKPVIYKYFTKPVLKDKNKRKDDTIRYKHAESKILKSCFGLFISESNQYPFYLKIQQKNAGQIFTALKSYNSTIKISKKYNFNKVNCFMFPLLTENRQLFIDKMEMNGIELGIHFSKSVEWAKKFGYKDGYCKNVEKIADQIVVCPCHYNLSEKEIALIK